MLHDIKIGELLNQMRMIPNPKAILNSILTLHSNVIKQQVHRFAVLMLQALQDVLGNAVLEQVAGGWGVVFAQGREEVGEVAYGLSVAGV
jgi:hypothetical protein